MASELFTFSGKRKYLTADERARFLDEAAAHHRPEVRTLCMTLAYTGCRISEALESDATRVDFSAKTLTFRTLKQRDKTRFRAVPIPPELLNALDDVHGIRKAQKRKNKGQGVMLWSWGRTQATKHICTVMDAAGISGEHASPKGLRHGFGVLAATTTRNPRLVQKWLGHTSLENTAIYMDVVGQEEHDEAARMW